MKLNSQMVMLPKLWIAAILLIFITSCQQSKSPELKFRAHHYQEEIHLFGNDNFPAITVDLKINLPTDSLAYSDLFNTMSITYFDSIYDASKSCDENLQYLDALITTNYKMLEEELQADSMDMGASYNWEIIKNNKIIYRNEHFLSFMNEQYEFTGGAHGNTTRNYYTYDLTENKILTSENTFKPNTCSAIIELQKQSLKSAGTDLSELWEEGFNCNHFYFTGKEIIFHYNQYEIASYAAGPIDIHLSISEIQPHLLDAGILKELSK